MHIYAPALYRLGKTQQVDEIYRQLVSSSNETVDIDEQEETLSNALANSMATYTPGTSLN